MTASKKKRKEKDKWHKRSEAVIFWCLDKPVLRELNNAILKKEFSFVGVKKKNKTKQKTLLLIMTNQPSGHWNMLFVRKNFLLLVFRKKNIAADHVRKPKTLTMTMPQTNFLSYYLRDTYWAYLGTLRGDHLHLNSIDEQMSGLRVSFHELEPTIRKDGNNNWVRKQQQQRLLKNNYCKNNIYNKEFYFPFWRLVIFNLRMPLWITRLIGLYLSIKKMVGKNMWVSKDRKMFVKNLNLPWWIWNINQIGVRGSLMEGAQRFRQGCKSWKLGLTKGA